MEDILPGDMEVTQIVNRVYASNSYILYRFQHDEAWLVDVGDADVIIRWIEEHSKKLKGVLLSHIHFDHIYGLNQLLDRYPDMIVFTSPEGREGLYSDKWNFSRYHHFPFIYAGSNVCILSDKQIMELWPGVMLHIIKTPGHDWSCLTYKIGSWLFTGDSYIPGLKVVTTFPKSNRIEAAKSTEIILTLADITKIFPGHGNVESVTN